MSGKFVNLALQCHQGNADAFVKLGYEYLAGKEISKNVVEAVTCFQRAAEKNHVVAQLNLGILYHQGIGVERSVEKAREWFYLSANQGNRIAQYNLGCIYQFGITGIAVDYGKAAYYYELSAKKEYGMAQNNLGWLYLKGLGVEQSNDLAFYWFVAAAKKGII